MGNLTSNAARSPLEDSVSAQLARIRASHAFARSARLFRFLEYTVEKTLAGGQDLVKEYAIGVDVYGRPRDYDPKVDSIVRTEAVRLRARLDDYYASEGSAETVRIRYQRGSYIPIFDDKTEIDSAVAIERGIGNAIVVLPFVNVDGSRENEFVCDGLTEELIGELATVGGIRVVARTSAFQFKGKAVDVRDAGRRLNAHAAVEGSVRLWNGRVRVTAQLIDVQTGLQRWSRTFERTADDLLDIQRELSGVILSALRPELSPRRGAHAPVPDPEAYRHYLEGRHHWGSYTLEGARKSIACFERALTHDPTHASTWATMADTLSFLVFRGAAGEASLRKARAAVLKALELEPRLSEAEVVFATLCSVHDWNWSEGERRFRRAVELAPSNADAHHKLGALCLLPQGRFADAADCIRTAVTLDPLACRIYVDLGRVLYAAGALEEAILQHDRALDLDPGFREAHWQLGLTLEAQGQYAEAMASYARALSTSQDTPATLGTLGHCYLKWGRTADALELLRRLESAPRESRGIAAYGQALIYTALGRLADAIDSLHECAETQAPRLLWLKIEPRFYPLRQEPRFQALLERMGLSGS